MTLQQRIDALSSLDARAFRHFSAFNDATKSYVLDGMEKGAAKLAEERRARFKAARLRN